MQRFPYIALALALLLLSACGQKGSLYRPEDTRFFPHSQR